jgi:hypothetical protein
VRQHKIGAEDVVDRASEEHRVFEISEKAQIEHDAGDQNGEREGGSCCAAALQQAGQTEIDENRWCD